MARYESYDNAVQKYVTIFGYFIIYFCIGLMFLCNVSFKFNIPIRKIDN